jgi:predicted nucleotidyltransferase component of viral defense system
MGKPLNMAGSVRQRLLNIIRETGEDANLVWSRYAAERLLYRLSVSDFAGDFVLKGAMLFMVWSGEPHRPTVDMDLLGYCEDSNEHIGDIFRRVCGADVEPDGLVFEPNTIRVTAIRGNQEYRGRRVNLTAFLGKARIPVQVDIGFGDVVTPRAQKVTYPTLLEFPAPRIRGCPQETVVAEKLQAMVALGIANSRMKDFYDLRVLARRFKFDGVTLVRAIRATFERRKTLVPTDPPLALTEEFGSDRSKLIQWNAFVRKSGLETGAVELPELLAELREFLLPLLRAVSGQGHSPGHWPAGGPWTK